MTKPKMKIGVEGTFYKVTRPDGFSFRRSMGVSGKPVQDANWFDMVGHCAVMELTTPAEKRSLRRPDLCMPGVIHASPTVSAALSYARMLSGSSGKLAVFEVRGVPVVCEGSGYSAKAGFRSLEVIRVVPRSEINSTRWPDHLRYVASRVIEKAPRTIPAKDTRKTY